jgi:hypothetical protein
MIPLFDNRTARVMYFLIPKIEACVDIATNPYLPHHPQTLQSRPCWKTLLPCNRNLLYLALSSGHLALRPRHLQFPVEMLLIRKPTALKEQEL